MALPYSYWAITMVLILGKSGVRTRIVQKLSNPNVIGSRQD
uniref:Uncharacterized protein n=1 Tax=Rhizophora mucronata TaxID=61149 RepID=A0A2P2IK59_RHIMU